MVRMLDILGDYLQARGLPFQRLDGTIPAVQRRQRIDHFNAPDSPDFCFLLSTRAGGLGINLMTADTCIIFDSDWNPQADLQAMGRAHRIGQKNHVMVYRLVSKDTIEEDVLERARRKMILEYAIINLGVTDKGKGQKSDLPSEELSAIIKSGASNMFKANNNQEKLENMNIDDVLEHAEDHDTTGSLDGAQLGGEDFLRQFEITDYKADVSWDEIIPKEDRERIEEEERVLQEQKATEELIALNTRRVAALTKRVNPGDTESLASEEPERKKRKSSKSVMAKKKQPKPEIDADRDLDVNDIRHLYNGMRRYGDLQGRYDDIVAGTDLAKLNKDNVLRTGEEMYQACLEAVKIHIHDKPQVEEPAQPENDVNGDAKPKVPGKPKAILIEFKGLPKVNAESILQRRDDMTFLHRILHRTAPVTNFRISAQVKSVSNWKSQWAAREDAMLLVGVDRHGHGGWYAIRDDPELGLTDKVFLDENKPEKKSAKSEGATKDIPGSIHLNRRTDYLFTVLREEHAKPGILDVLSGKTVETPVKEPKSRPRASGSSKASSSKKVINGEAGSTPEKRRTSSDPSWTRIFVPVTHNARVNGQQSKPSDDKRPKEPSSDYESMDEEELKVPFHSFYLCLT